MIESRREMSGKVPSAHRSGVAELALSSDGCVGL